jgi:hypothetical protein
VIATVYPEVLLYAMKLQHEKEPETTKHPLTQDHDTTHLWGRIVNLKLQQIILILALFTILFYIGGAWSKSSLAPHWELLTVFPWDSLASACLGSLLVAFAYEWFIRKEADTRLTQKLEQRFQAQEQSLVKEITSTLLKDRDLMKRMLSPDTVNSIIQNGLEARLGDERLAHELYAGHLSQLLQNSERKFNYRCNIYLAPLKNGHFSEDIKQKYYEGYIDINYDTFLQKNSFRFTCVKNMKDYNSLLNEPGHELRWVTELTKDFSVLDETVFDVESIYVDNLSLEIKRESQGEQFVILAEHPKLDSLQGQRVKVYYRYKVKLQKRGHLLMIHIPCPTQNVIVELDYASTDIHYVNVLDFFGSRTTSKIRHMPSQQKCHKVEVEVNEWIFPKGGVVFAWVLRSEMTSGFIKLMTDDSAHR